MEKLLNFIDHLCIDDQLYWRVPLRDGSGAGLGDVEVRWQRDLWDAAWSVKAANFEKSVATRDLLAALAEAGADQEHFERQLGASVLTQAVFADMVREGAVEIFGADVVARSVDDTRAFLQSVSDTTAQLAPKLRLVRE